MRGHLALTACLSLITIMALPFAAATDSVDLNTTEPDYTVFEPLNPITPPQIPEPDKGSGSDLMVIIVISCAIVAVAAIAYRRKR